MASKLKPWRYEIKYGPAGEELLAAERAALGGKKP